MYTKCRWRAVFLLACPIPALGDRCRYHATAQQKETPLHSLIACFLFAVCFQGSPVNDATDTISPDANVSVTGSAEPLWNSLEVAKLATSVLLPITLALIGLWINHRINKMEKKQWTNQKIIEKRLKVFDECAPLANQLFCYFTRVGGWKEMKPPDILKIKRKLDQIIYVHSTLFPNDFNKEYQNFIHTFFQTFNGPGEDARLKTTHMRHQQTAGSEWKDEWSCLFTQKMVADYELKKVYNDFMQQFRLALEIEGRDQHNA